MPGTRRSRTRLAVLASVLALVLGSTGPVAGRDRIIVSGRGGCPVLPATNVWNKRVDALAVRSDSATLMGTMGLGRYVHPDFGSNPAYGIPVNAVNGTTPRRSVDFWWPDESDPGPYPIPAVPLVEGAGAGGDRHILMLDKGACRLWELFAAEKAGGAWTAGSGAIFDLRSTPSGRTAGRPPTPRASRSCPASSATTRCTTRA